MEFTGKAINLSRDWNSGKFHLTLEVNENEVIKNHYDSIKDLEKLSVPLKNIAILEAKMQMLTHGY